MKPEVNGPQDFELIILLIILLMKKLRVDWVIPQEQSKYGGTKVKQSKSS